MDPETDYYELRYSIAFFDQSCECLLMVSIGQSVSKLTTWIGSSCTIQGPLKKYPAVTEEEFMRSTMNRNFAILKAKKDIMATEAEKSG